MWQKEQVIHELQKSGGRVMKQQEILLEIILDSTWSCCKEIYYKAIGKDPPIGLATVYRMAGALERIGMLTRSYHYCLPIRGSESGQLGAQEGDMAGGIMVGNGLSLLFIL